jgi:hypothetical protein
MSNTHNTSTSNTSNFTNQDQQPLLTEEKKKFDIYQFNQNFQEYKQSLKNDQVLKDQQKLAELNKLPPPKKIYEYNIYEILLGIKDTWFDIIDDILALRFTIDIVLKDNRLFFLGITFILIGVILYIYNILLNSKDESDIKTENTKIIHIYHMSNDKNAIKDNMKDMNYENI